MTFTWWRLSSPWKQGLGTMSLTYSKGCCMIWLRGSWSLTRHRSTSSGPYRRSLKLRSELYRTRTSKTKRPKTHLFSSFSKLLMMIIEDGNTRWLCNLFVIICMKSVLKRVCKFLRNVNITPHHDFFFQKCSFPPCVHVLRFNILSLYGIWVK